MTTSPAITTAPHKTGRGSAPRAAGVVLLEVVLALTLFVLAATVIGSALRSTATASHRIERDVRALNLAQTILTELVTGQLDLIDTPPTDFTEKEEQEGAAAEPDPMLEGWTYEIETEELVDLPSLLCVTVTVRHDEPDPAFCLLTQWMPAPAEEQIETTEGAGR